MFLKLNLILAPVGLESGGGIEPLDYRAVCLLSLRYVAPYAPDIRGPKPSRFMHNDVKSDSRTSQPALQAGRASLLPALGPPDQAEPIVVENCGCRCRLSGCPINMRLFVMPDRHKSENKSGLAPAPVLSGYMWVNNYMMYFLWVRCLQSLHHRCRYRMS